MASHSAKQEFYRRLMKEKKAKSSSVQRIDHPFARYNQLDQLNCVLCSTLIKSELLWQTHLQSKQHKEKVNELKSLKAKSYSTKTSTKPSPLQQHDSTEKLPNRQTNSTNISPAPTKRKHSDDIQDNQLKRKQPEAAVPVASYRSEGLPSDFFDNSGNGSSTIETESQNSTSLPPSSTDLPPDFFDAPTQDNDDVDDVHQQTDSENKKSNRKPSDSEIPEGFFDDPKMDAKKRKVEYKDPQEAAWENFKKTISKETEVSEAIVEKGDEVMQDDRELMEVNEQVACFNKAEELRLKQEQLRDASFVKKEPLFSEDITVKTECEETEEEEDNDSVDLDELSDWRFRTHN